MSSERADERYMKRALQLARRGMGKVSPNPMVGAVIVRSDKVIAEGYHRTFGGDHAERDALKRASGSVRGATIYVNLEPCCHWGKTPPCVDALIEQGIKRTVIATLDPHPLVDGKGAQILQDHGIEVVKGVLEDEARALNEVYFHYTQTGRPFITVKYAQSLDGRIATSQGDSRWISSEASQKLAHRLRAQHDAVMVGIGTVLADDPLLTVREVKGRNPLRIVLDSRLRTPRKAQVLQGEAKTLIVTTEAHATKKVHTIQQGGKEVLTVPRNTEGRVDVKTLMQVLAERGISSILVEGGAAVITSLLKGELVERMVVITAPLIVGKGIEGIGDLGITELKQAIRPSSYTVSTVGEDVIFDLRL